MEKNKHKYFICIIIIVKIGPRISLLPNTESYAEQVHIVVKADRFTVYISAGWRKA